VVSCVAGVGWVVEMTGKRRVHLSVEVGACVQWAGVVVYRHVCWSPPCLLHDPQATSCQQANSLVR
jgi:hypothetical protein